MYLAQKMDQMTTKIMHSQDNIMDRLIIFKREKCQPQNPPPRHQYNNNRQPRGNQGWNRNRPPPKQRVPNALAPSDMINQEDIPWCFPCNECHREWKCPRNQFHEGGEELIVVNE